MCTTCNSRQSLTNPCRSRNLHCFRRLYVIQERGKLNKVLARSTTPILQFDGRLKDFICIPLDRLVILSARRSSALPAPNANSNTGINVCIVDGFADMQLEDYTRAVRQLLPDVAIAPGDIPFQKPGRNRVAKMLQRTEQWLVGILEARQESSAIFASIVPLQLDVQQEYLQTLKDKALDGIALHDAAHVSQLDIYGISNLVRILVIPNSGPRDMLRSIAQGVDLVTADWLVDATDSGFALVCHFQEISNDIEHALVIDLWEEMYAGDPDPILSGCSCAACRNHTRGYIHHLLQAKEMLAWVLLQM